MSYGCVFVVVGRSELRETREPTAEAELTSGIEPLTACLQNRCSAGLSYVSVEAATTTASSL